MLANLVERSQLKTQANKHFLYAANNPAFGLLVAFIFQREVRILEITVQDILHLIIIMLEELWPFEEYANSDVADILLVKDNPLNLSD